MELQQAGPALLPPPAPPSDPLPPPPPPPPPSPSPPQAQADGERTQEGAEFPDVVDGSKQPYAALEVASDATQGEIRKAFRRLSKQFHPDKQQQHLGADSAAARYASARFVQVRY
jgi:hypothetical protein